MLTAKEAEIEAIKNRCSLSENELRNIEAEITNAIEQGEFLIKVKRALLPETIQKLQKLGYKVGKSVIDKYCADGYYYTIEW